MNILVFSGYGIPAAQRFFPDWRITHDVSPWPDTSVSLNSCVYHPDAIVCMSVARTDEAFRAVERWPSAPLFVYHWDCYGWVWTRPRAGEYDYVRYGELLRRAVEFWVPSECTGQQARSWWDLTNWRVIHPCAPVWDDPQAADRGYALCTLRMNPDDCAGWFESACRELQIPYKMPDHDLSYADYQEAVAGCRFIVNHFREASTGGLSLLEAYHLGKRVLCTDSPWNGAREYFGDRACYFAHDDYDRFKHRLAEMYLDPHATVAADHAEWVRRNFSDERMLGQMLERIHAYTG